MLSPSLLNRTVYFPSFLSEGGEMSQYILAHDWSGSTLGNMSGWPQSLQTTLSIMLHSRLPMLLCWGPDRIIFYNDAYAPLLHAGDKHPWALGRKAPFVFPASWQEMEPLIDHAIIQGGYSTLENQCIPVMRHGHEEVVHWTCNYSPVTIEDGYRGGVLVSFFETPGKSDDTMNSDRSMHSSILQGQAGRQHEETQAQSNEDLQQLAHVASHDLKEPLRKISIYIGRLDAEYKKTLPGKAQKYIDNIQSSVDRMFSMVEGILYYSKLNTAGQSIEKIDLNGVMANIESDLEILIGEKQARLEYKDLPVIEGLSIFIYQLFYNLIHNSLKFSKDDEKPFIHVSHRQFTKDNIAYAEIIIHDNGIGFDQQQSENFFNTFVRLNPKENYEGAGLGLTLCKKIVLRHHGSITAKGESNMGAEILITLPLQFAG